MKTAFVFQHYPPFPGAGARRAKSIVKSYVASQSTDSNEFYLLTTEKLAVEPNVNVTTFGHSEIGNKRSFFLRAIEELVLGIKIAFHLVFIKKYDRVVLSTPSYLASIPISLALFCKRIPYVIELRDIYPESFLEAGLITKNSWFYKALRVVSSKMYSNAVGILCATDGLKKLLIPYKNLPPVNLVYNGFDVHCRSQTEVKYDEFTVCFHGVLGVFQDINGLVTVANKLRELDIKLLVIGYGAKEHLLQFSTNIDFLGKKSHAETMDIISKCHVGLSLRGNDQISVNSFPVKVWEYIGMEMPCIVSPPSEAGEFVELNGLGRQVNFGDYDEIINIILEYKGSQNLCSTEKVSSEYTRERTGMAAAIKIANYFREEL